MVLAFMAALGAVLASATRQAAIDSLGRATTCVADSASFHAFLTRYRAGLSSKLTLERGALVVVCHDSIVFLEGFGRTAAGDAVDPNRTIFRAASNSKLFAATAVMQLADSGLWKLDDDVNRYLPPAARLASRPSSGPVTLENLLTHTAGFEDKFAGGVVVPADRLTLAEFFARHSPRRVAAPGAEVSYSNIGMALAGYLVEARTGEPFARYAERHIFAPLGMTRSTFDQPPPAAWSRDLAGGTLRGRYDVVFNPYPAASLVTTPADMGRFIAAHLARGGQASALGATRLLSPTAMESMHASHWRAQPDVPGVAYGFFEGTLAGHRTLFHTGDSGDHSLVLLLPDERLGLYFVFSGRDDQLPARDELVRQLARMLFPDSASRSIASIASNSAASNGAWSSPTVAQLAGTYRSSAYSRSNYEKVRALFAQVTLRAGPSGSLLVAPPGSSDAIELRRTGSLTFARDSGEVVAFRRSADGRLVGFTLSGLIWDPSSWDRISWWQNGRLHLAALGIAVLVLVARLLWTPAAWIMRRARKRAAPERSPRERRLWRWSGLTATLFCAAPVIGAATALTSFAHPLRAVPRGVAVATTLWLIAVVFGVALAPASVTAWRTGDVPRPRLVAISLTAVACTAIAIILWYWNLLAPWSVR